MERVVLHAECGDGVGEISRLANAFGPAFHVGANAPAETLLRLVLGVLRRPLRLV